MDLSRQRRAHSTSSVMKTTSPYFTKKTLFEVDLDKLDEMLQPDESLRPKISILTPPSEKKTSSLPSTFTTQIETDNPSRKTSSPRFTLLMSSSHFDESSNEANTPLSSSSSDFHSCHDPSSPIRLEEDLFDSDSIKISEEDCSTWNSSSFINKQNNLYPSDTLAMNDEPELTKPKRNSIRSLQWLHDLISKLYSYCYDIFQKKGDKLLNNKTSFSASTIISSIMKTKFVFDSDVSINWDDMCQTVKAYKDEDFEVEMFHKFLFGEYPLKSFFWYVRTSQLTVQSPKGESVPETIDVTCIPFTSNRRSVLSTLVTKKKQDSNKEEAKGNSITLPKAIAVLCGLCDKGFIKPYEIFGDWACVKKDRREVKEKKAEEFIIRKFHLQEGGNEKEDSVQLVEFMGFLRGCKYSNP